MFIILHRDNQAEGVTHVIKMGVRIEGLILESKDLSTFVEPVALGTLCEVEAYITNQLGWEIEKSDISLWDEQGERKFIEVWEEFHRQQWLNR